MDLHSKKSQALGVALAVTTIAGVIAFIIFGGHVGPYGRLFGLREEAPPPRQEAPREGEEEGEDVPPYTSDISTVLLHTREVKKDIAANCTPGTEQKDASTSGAMIELTYPRICDPTFDGTVEYIAGRLADDFKSHASTLGPGAGGRTLLLSLEPQEVFVNNTLGSVLLAAHIDLGGAHGTTVYYSVNVDRGLQKRLLLADLFDEGSGYLEFISERARGELVRKLGRDVVVQGGVAPSEKNFLVFTLDQGAITFHFEPYQVAPYAAGPQFVVIPFSELGPYWRR